MEFFLPSLIILILAGITSFALIPRLSPVIILILSLALLTFGMYHHYKLFAAEYRQSTWQEQLKFYAPGIAIGGLVLFILIFVVSLFRKGEVPIPNMPTVTPASTANNMTAPLSTVINTVTTAANNVINSASDITETISNSATNAINKVTNTVNNTLKNTGRNAGAAAGNIRPSFFNKV